MNIFENPRVITFNMCFMFSMQEKYYLHIRSGVSANIPAMQHLIKLGHLKKNRKIIIQVVLGDSKTLREVVLND